MVGLSIYGKRNYLVSFSTDLPISTFLSKDEFIHPAERDQKNPYQEHITPDQVDIDCR